METVGLRVGSRRCVSVRASFSALVDLALPPTCASCGAADARLCDECHEAIREALWDGGPRWVAPEPAPLGIPQAVSAGRYEGPLARVLSAYKDDGRRDCAPLLAELLSASVQTASAVCVSDGLWRDSPAADDPGLRARTPLLVVPIPSSGAARRRRGDWPLAALAARACRGFSRSEVRVVGVLHHRRRLADQAGLDAAGRAANLEQSMVVRPRWRPLVAGSVCLLADDVMTTGATLAEAARALRGAGAREVRAATICATQRRSGRPIGA